MKIMNWHYTKENDFPQSTEGKPDEFQCLVYDHGQYKLLYWNDYYKCWDDENGDDYYCDKENIQKWCYLDTIINELDN